MWLTAATAVSYTHLNDIKTLYDKFKGLSLKDKTNEETAGADVTSFRFNLSDGTSYDWIYACYGVKNGELKSAAGGFKYFTSADIGSYWNNLNTYLEAIPINESELPWADSKPSRACQRSRWTAQMRRRWKPCLFLFFLLDGWNVRFIALIFWILFSNFGLQKYGIF